MARIVECSAVGRLVVRHRCSERLTDNEVIERFGISARFTVVAYPEGRPDLSETIQTERSP
jgi:hypothetical protein